MPKVGIRLLSDASASSGPCPEKNASPATMTAPALSCAAVAKAPAISSGVRADTPMTSMPKPLAAPSTFFATAAWDALPGFVSTAMRASPGSRVFSISTCFELRSTAMADSPVVLPPGRDRLATRPLPTGSTAAAMTIGIVRVARWAACTAAVPQATTTSTFSPTRSAASLSRPA